MMFTSLALTSGSYPRSLLYEDLMFTSLELTKYLLTLISLEITNFTYPGKQANLCITLAILNRYNNFVKWLVSSSILSFTMYYSVMTR